MSRCVVEEAQGGRKHPTLLFMELFLKMTLPAIWGTPYRRSSIHCSIHSNYPLESSVFCIYSSFQRHVLFRDTWAWFP